MSVFNKKRFTLRRFSKKPKVENNRESEGSEESIETQREHESSNTEEIILPPVLEGGVPTYFHIGGLAKDCLVTGYKIGAWHFDCTSRASDKLSFYSFGTGKPKFRNVFGGVGLSEQLGIFKLSQVWQTDGILGLIKMEAGAVGGWINAMLRAKYTFNTGNVLKLDLQTGYEHTPIKFDLIIPILNEPKLMGYVLLQPANNFMLAYRAVYDINEKEFDTHAIGAGYNNGSTEIGLKLENFKRLRGSIFQQIGDNWAIAVKANLFSDEGTQFAIGGQYQLDNNSLIKARVRDDGYVGLVYKARLGESIGIMYHVGIDASAPIKGNHKIGISWTLKD